MTVYSMRTYHFKDRLFFTLSVLIVLFAVYIMTIIFIGSQPPPPVDETIRIKEYFAGVPVSIWMNTDENGYPLPGVYCVNFECMDKVTRSLYCFAPLPPEPEKVLFWERKSKYFSLPISDYMIAYDDYRFFSKDPHELINKEPTFFVEGP